MATDDVNTSQDTEMAECDGEKVVTMMDVLQEQQDFEEDANAVLGASDEKNCTYSKGYIKRQAVYACLTCCTEAKTDPTKRAGVCLACSLNCHENHELVELYTKRNFCCDCGNPKFNSHPCQFISDKKDLNEENIYNQNFSGLYCICHRPYPDPEATVEDEMIQCIICEDWLHSSHLDAILPANDQYSEMICKDCMEKNMFLHDYSDLAVVAETVDILTVNGSLNNSILENGSVRETTPEKEIEEKKSDIEMLEENKSELESGDQAVENKDSEKIISENGDGINDNTNKNKPDEDNSTQINIPMEAQDTETTDLKMGEKENEESDTIPNALVESNDNTKTDEALVNTETETKLLEENVSNNDEITSQKLESFGTEIDKHETETVEKLDSDESPCKSGNADNNKTLMVETSTENKVETEVITSTAEHSDKTENNPKEVLEETISEANRIDDSETPLAAKESNIPENIDREQTTPDSQLEEPEITSHITTENDDHKQNADNVPDTSTEDITVEPADKINTDDEMRQENELLNENEETIENEEKSDLVDPSVEITSHITTENDDHKQNADNVPDTSTEDITVEPADKINTDDEMRQENELLNENEETIENEEKSDLIDPSVNNPDPAIKELITDAVQESTDKTDSVGLNDSTGQPDQTTEFMETKPTQESTDKECNITENEPSNPNSPESKPDQSTEEMKMDTIQKSTDTEDNLIEKQENTETSDLIKNKQDEDLAVKVTDTESTKKDDVENKEAIESNNTEMTDETLRSLEPSINKRKLSTEDEESTSKKQKIIEKECTRPKNVKKIFKGATFWPMHFRQKLCTCNECLSMYKDLSVLFLIDPEDTVMAYETLGMEKVNGAPSQYEKGLQALSSLDRVQQINALTEYNRMRDKLLDFLKSFKEKKEIVKEEDIKAFFAGMKPKREPDGVYFCR